MGRQLSDETRRRLRAAGQRQWAALPAAEKRRRLKMLEEGRNVRLERQSAAAAERAAQQPPAARSSSRRIERVTFDQAPVVPRASAPATPRRARSSASSRRRAPARAPSTPPSSEAREETPSRALGFLGRLLAPE